MRTLLYVPMIHRMDETLLGAESYQDEEQAELGESLLDVYWNLILKVLTRRIQELGLQSKGGLDLDVFCESWTYPEQIAFLTRHAMAMEEMVPSVHALSGMLAKVGARLRVTENMIVHWLEGVAYKLQFSRERPPFGKTLMEWRDLSIVGNLNRQVKEGGTAVLFLGAGHDVPAFLDQDWRVEVLTAAEIAIFIRHIDATPKVWTDLYTKQSDRHRITSGELDEVI